MAHVWQLIKRVIQLCVVCLHFIKKGAMELWTVLSAAAEGSVDLFGLSNTCPCHLSLIATSISLHTFY